MIHKYSDLLQSKILGIFLIWDGGGRDFSTMAGVVLSGEEEVGKQLEKRILGKIFIVGVENESVGGR